MRDCGVEQHRSHAQAVDVRVDGEQRDLVVMRQWAFLEQAVVGSNGGAHKREVLGASFGLQLAHLRQQRAFGIHPMFVDSDAGALSCACKRNAARLTVDYGNLRKRR